MITKHLLRADRQRQIPPSFSWVDHRLIRHGHLRGCDHSAWALKTGSEQSFFTVCWFLVLTLEERGNVSIHAHA